MTLNTISTRRFLPAAVLALLIAPAWAKQPIVEGVENYQKVDEYVYRGAQPTDEGFKKLAALGIKTVIDLRREGENGGHSIDNERRIVESGGMKFISIPMNGVVAPSDETMKKILTLMNSRTEGPVFVHCRRGADRTGAVIACYRIQHDNWKNQDALKEAKAMGMSWLQFGIKKYVDDFRAAIMFPDPAVAPIPHETAEAAAAR